MIFPLNPPATSFVILDSQSLKLSVLCCTLKWPAVNHLNYLASQEFRQLAPLKFLYCSLIHPVLEYGSVLWNPNTSVANDMIERLQRNIPQMIAFRLDISCLLRDYSPVLIALGLSSLADCGRLANLLFLSKLLSSRIDSPSLRSKINSRVPSNNTRRSFVSFLIPLFFIRFPFEFSRAVRLSRVLQTSIALFRYSINYRTSYGIAIRPRRI